jgi:hypothetical protein
MTVLAEIIRQGDKSKYYNDGVVKDDRGNCAELSTWSYLFEPRPGPYIQIDFRVLLLLPLSRQVLYPKSS